MGKPRTLIKGGTVVTDRGVSRQDILIQGERIARLGDLSSEKTTRVIDASGFLVLPGAVDPHVHFNNKFISTTSIHDFYPEEYNGCYAACPDPIDFRTYGLVNIYEDKNA